jgi:hypothetical protein
MPTILDWRWKDETGTGKATTVYTIVDDGDEINIRAVITQRWELAELVTKLQQRVDGKPTNITTMIGEGHRSDAQDVNRKELSNE